MITIDLLKFTLVSICFISNTVIAGEIALMPKAVTVGNVTYVTGGIGEEESSAMKDANKNYQLEIVFVQKTDEKEEFISDVKLKIQDSEMNPILEVVTEGPFLLANLPNGKYVITAEFNDIAKRQKIFINHDEHKKVVFWWPILDQQQMEYVPQ